MRRAGLALAAALASALCLAAASDPAERLPDPAQEARARTLFKEVRCMVCQNESIEDSQAELAVDLRRLVRERVAAGDDDVAVRRWLVERYGEFVMLRPAFSIANLVLWLAPLAAVMVGGLALMARVRGAGAETEWFTPEESARLAELVRTADGHDPAFKSSPDDPKA
ncbi:MAG: cytochrome c-type biogenesis protein CcmH [Phenylobacterium sp.]|uniref:cytochrome c-type biogenesis protein n=2 Tax=Phenylobacterium sp. TaxID=1871053 RepID=UPI0025DEF17B|nr:cytochrome c-type biogenesis protein [Phenylobacterium sp.]MCA6226503.1 cytochrome c-type biogenesis protein CcmH [Phenylobacterium sp.]MCA6232586.1 cytochrome c-type biogenesis protein CcmH [Phenylobacterium sp.]MCA6234768.1 cytochrome c-type biogenesis protein CcmH [Phenylobacterium sp.]MCA6247858.1 cytochrome c-type biogenesis protein CcmH [Phenylobacterium sp.]MCA6252738.1 cytochrome c-type biogenesis protein CcmH [Phenylobacterium sp.]